MIHDAGDQVGHLWWRLLNGDIPVQKHPKAVVVLIGTNDLTADDCLRTEEASMTAVVGIVSRCAVVWVYPNLPATCRAKVVL